MPLLPVRRFRVVENRKETSETFTLVLEPADGGAMFTFLAGQFIMLHLFNPDGTVWARAAYSIATAPSESTSSFELGIKLHGDFTKRCAALAAGDEVGVQGPYGAFVLKPDTERLVFFAAGIGVTPLRGMIREALLTDKPVDIYLLYSEKSRDRIAYEREFRDLAARHPRFHPIFVLTREQPEGWDGESSRIDAAMVKKYLPNPDKGRYCMCGPAGFMADVKAMLAAEGVDVNTKLQKESFD